MVHYNYNSRVYREYIRFIFWGFWKSGNGINALYREHLIQKSVSFCNKRKKKHIWLHYPWLISSREAKLILPRVLETVSALNSHREHNLLNPDRPFPAVISLFSFLSLSLSPSVQNGPMQTALAF